jgi:hypothetical protein
MIPSISSRCTYDPEVVKIMSKAFDRACEALPVQFKDSDRVRRKLALLIIHQIDEGESDPTRLADAAVLSLHW